MELWQYIAEFKDDTVAAKALGITARSAQLYRLKQRWPKPDDVPDLIKRSNGLLDWEGVYRSKVRSKAIG